jgi:hypothetical protein
MLSSGAVHGPLEVGTGRAVASRAVPPTGQTGGLVWFCSSFRLSCSSTLRADRSRRPNRPLIWHGADQSSHSQKGASKGDHRLYHSTPGTAQEAREIVGRLPTQAESVSDRFGDLEKVLTQAARC